MYFNQKYERSGSLFQGPFKSKFIDTDQDLRQVLAYVANNNHIHNITDPHIYRSSINTSDPLVRDLVSNFDHDKQIEVANIIKSLREGFDD